MDQSKNNVLLLATTSYAGMGPYVASIVNSFSSADNVSFFLVEDDSRYYTNNILPNLLPKCKIVHLQLNKWMTLINLTMHPTYFFHKDLKQYCEENMIDTIHCLTSFHDAKFIRWFNSRGRFILTIHDLIQHESNKSVIKEFRQNTLFKRMERCIKESQEFVTNSLNQKAALQQNFPSKSSYYLPFPSLITDNIKQGDQIPTELISNKPYILFFGRIEEYKGLSLLLKANEKCESKYQIVIAGKGFLPYQTERGNITFINRYIDDKEIRFLYSNAKYIVYPYLSATQTGVLSLATYFGKPMILSDISFFRDSVGENECAVYFNKGNSDSLATAMMEMENTDMEIRANRSRELYNHLYSNKAIKNNLLSIYCHD